jgi:hypothetical protein
MPRVPVSDQHSNRNLNFLVFTPNAISAVQTFAKTFIAIFINIDRLVNFPIIRPLKSLLFYRYHETILAA